jgi:lipocalin
MSYSAWLAWMVMRSSRAVQSIILNKYSPKWWQVAGVDIKLKRKNTQKRQHFQHNSLQTVRSPAKTMQDKNRSEDAVSPRTSQHTASLQSDCEYRYSHVGCIEWHAHAARPRNS